MPALSLGIRSLSDLFLLLKDGIDIEETVPGALVTMISHRSKTLPASAHHLGKVIVQLLNGVIKHFGTQ